MNYTKEILVKDYSEIHNFYSKIYGINTTIILMQVGSFYEVYCTDTDGPNLSKIAEELDVICTKKNNKEPVSKSNPYMLGFPLYVVNNYIEKLCLLNFTVILIEQTSDPPLPKREITNIYSPSTFIEKTNINKSNNLVSIVIDKIKLIKPQLAIGVSSFDLSTGNGSYYESYSTMEDPLYALDDIKRYFESFEPSEIILYYTLTDDEEINNMNIKNILNYLGFNSNILIFNYNKYSTNTVKLSYQKIILEKIFNNIFEILNLHLYNFARLSLVNLLEYTKNHQGNLLNKLKLPTQFENDKILFLGNDALNQLDIFHKNGLFNIINYTKTIIGKRFLENNLKKPLINKLEIEERLNLIDKLLNNNLSDYLENIGDLERLIRKIELETLLPSQLNNLYVSFYQIDKLIEYLKKNHLIESFNIQHDNVKILLEYINNTFYLDKLNNIDNSYFKSNIYKDIDLLQDKIDSSNNFMNNLVIVLEKIIIDEKIYLKYNDRDGHYLILTNRRCSVLQSKLEKMTEINVGSIKLKVEDLEFNQLPKSSNTKISCRKIKEISNEINIYKTEINKLLKEKFKEQLNYILDNFGIMINYWSNKIGFIDFINSGAICAINNKYIKPILVDYKESYFKVSGLRHALVEHINTNVSYKTHDIALGGINELNGIILFGVNGAGKSTLMKAIGICIIMAQMGYYVPASNLELSVYKSLLTRISSNDNIYKGLSSFYVEMSELTSILKRNNCNTLILADEVCKGTETKSATIIIATMLSLLEKSKASFITASHLHNIMELPCIKKLNKIKPKHLKILIEDDKIIYDRVLSDGIGELFYGLTISKYLMKDSNFNELTSQILLEYENNNVKQSNYNSNNYLIECLICGSKRKLETHHIIFQKEFLNTNFINIKKDRISNLVTLCMSCHDDVDRDKIIINGWKETSEGVILDYEYNNNIKKKSKYSDEIIEYIKSFKNEYDEKIVRSKVKEKFDKKVSINKIKSLWL